MNSKKNLLMIFPLSIISHRSRLIKLASVASSLNLSISTWSWERNKGDFNKELPINNFKDRKIILKGGGYNSKWIKLYYPLWMFLVFFKLLLNRPKYPIYCLGFETAFPALIASKLTKIRYIFDDADRFSMIVKFPNLISSLVRFLEKKTSEGSLVHIIPGRERYEFENEKQIVVKNMPDRNVIENSKKNIIQRPLGSIVIYVNGWMGETRGLPIILELAKRFLAIKADVHFIAAGNANEPSASKFIKLENVTYLGSVKNHEALSWYRVSDFVFTYYDPSIDINHYAESNKWGDGLAFSVPVIVNKEVVTSKFLQDSNSCISVPYHDIDSLENSLNMILKDRNHLDNMKKNISTLASKVIYFDAEMKIILKKII